MTASWRRIASALRVLLTGDNARYYEHLGADLLHHEAAPPAAERWLNLGYWRAARTYPAAAADLARLLARAARFEPGLRVLDCGCGFAAQDFLWLREYGLAEIDAVNLAPHQVEFARRAAAEIPTAGELRLHLGSATKLPFAPETFDCVVSLESAFHYRTRLDFFREAFRVLRPGGRLALADMLPLPGTATGNWYQRLARRYTGIPAENLVDRHAYSVQLEELGFTEVEVESIRDWVFPGFYRYARGRRAGAAPEQPVELGDDDIRLCRGAEHWARETGLDDYVIAAARKP